MKIINFMNLFKNIKNGYYVNIFCQMKIEFLIYYNIFPNVLSKNMMSSNLSFKVNH